jgi:DNA-directed RNA polymerase specialized sigma24 family protein
VARVEDSHERKRQAARDLERVAIEWRELTSQRERLMLEASQKGLSIREIAALMDASPSSVGDWVKRARLRGRS